MRCYHVYDKELGQVLIPCCYSTLYSDDIKDCTCKYENMTFKEFEKEEYNKKLKELISEIETLRKENNELHKLLELNAK